MNHRIRRVVVGAAAFVGVTLAGGAALAGPLDALSGRSTTSDHAASVATTGETAGGLPGVSFVEALDVDVDRVFVTDAANGVADIVDQVGQGLGGIKPKPLPGPTPGWLPPIVHEQADNAMSLLDEVGKGLGGVKPPTPPTPPGWMPPLPI